MSGHPRFSRIALAIATLLLAGLLQACSSEITPDPIPPVIGPGTCPTIADFPANDKRPPDHPGPLVPRDGAASVTLCVMLDPLASTSSIAKSYDKRVEEPRKLTLRAAEVVEALSTMSPSEHEGPAVCVQIGYNEIFSLVVAYENGRQVTVYLDRNCSSAYAEGRTRISPNMRDSYYPIVLDGFLARYREQLATTTDRAKVKATACAAQESASVRLADGIGINRGERPGYLPDTLVEVTACRYDLAKGALRLTAKHTQRGDLTALRDTLDTNLHDARFSSCSPSDAQVTRLDILWIADVTGSVSGLWLRRAPCAALHAAHSLAVGWAAPIDSKLRAQLDAWLK